MSTRGTYAIVPGSRLETLLGRLKRPERRLMLGIMASRNPVRRERMRRDLERRLREQKILVPDTAREPHDH